VLSRAALLGGASAFVAFFALSRLPLEPFVFIRASHFALFLVAVAVILVPFTCFGVYVCLALSRWPQKIGVLYAANLVGSGVGCALTVVMLDSLGVSASMLASGLIAWAAGLLDVAATRTNGRKALIAVVTLGLVALTAVATNELNPLVYVRSAKFFPRLAREDVLVRESNSLSSVEIFRDKGGLGAWGVSPLYTKPLPHFIGFSIDGWALTSIFNRAEADVPESILDFLPAGLPYKIHPPKDVLVIGAGGGVDVLTALHNGAQHVTGVEINSIIIDSVEHRYADFAGHLYQDPRVEIHNDEGRHYLKSDPRKYDVIQLSGVDTFAASQAGAFALHENYLYTVEALHDYLNSLSPGGMLTFTRWLYIPPRQTIRLVAMVEQAFRERGAANPANHVVIFNMQRFSVVLVKNDEFTKDDVDRVQTEVVRRGFQLLYAPFVRVNPLAAQWGDTNPFYKIWDEGPAAFIAGYPFDIRPSVDDRPFFFEYQRWTRPVGPITENTVFVLFQKENAQLVLLGTLAFSALAAGTMLVLGRKRAKQQGLTLGASAHVYFAALGLAYIAVENVLVQRMILCLGRPAYALTVILCTLLIASGVGSLVGARVGGLLGRPRTILALVVALLLAYSVALRPALDAVLGLGLGARIAIVALLIAPLGVLMGMPFPWAIARLTAADDRLVPFAWVVNGAASVLGGSITVILAMATGFTSVFWVAAALYALAALVSAGLERDAAAAAQRTSSAGR
jgi:spermidine synthase